jgi:hypothetical protein
VVIDLGDPPCLSLPLYSSGYDTTHPPYTPRHNSKVERSYRKDNEDFYAFQRFYSFEDFKAQFAVRERAYNNFPIRPLAWRAPKQVLFAFHNV